MSPNRSIVRLLEGMPRGVEFYLGAATLSALVAATALAYYQPFVPEADLHNNPFILKAKVENNRLQVDWDAEHPALDGAEGGTLRVLEGADRKEYPVERKVLQSGGLDYLQSGPEALLSLTIHHQKRRDVTAYVRLVSAPPPPQPVVAEAKPRPTPTQTRTRRGRRR
jgi:hypothetical protein